MDPMNKIQRDKQRPDDTEPDLLKCAVVPFTDELVVGNSYACQPYN
jgi:hypothetical protein